LTELNLTKENDMSEEIDLSTEGVEKITMHELFIIHSSLVETYNNWHRNYKEGTNENNYTQEQVENILRNLYEVYVKVDKLVDPFKKNLEQFMKNNQQEQVTA